MAKTKELINFAVTAKLICVFVFAYADCWFSLITPVTNVGPFHKFIINKTKQFFYDWLENCNDTCENKIKDLSVKSGIHLKKVINMSKNSFKLKGLLQNENIFSM